MLSLTIGGTLGGDPETRETNSGSEVTSFSVAVNGYDPKKREKTTTWVKVTMFGKRGAQIGELLGKGDKCVATGTARLSEWTDRSGKTRTTLELTASDVTPMGKAAGASEDRPSKGGAKAEDDDIPF